MLLFLCLRTVRAQSSFIESELQSGLTNHTALWDTIVGWSASPSYRGTIDILWSCLVTIFASIYTAIHLDIPTYHVSSRKRLKNRLHWAAICLIAPEFTLLAVFAQYAEARKLRKTLMELDRNRSELETATVSSHKQSSKYGMAYAFWAAMGGFIIDISDIRDDQHHVALTSSGIAFLARHGYRIDVSNEHIADHSKANILGKLLVCMQVSWMLLQAFVRLGSGYPLTLLEIHTAVHVACALLIYALWWKKPLDVEEPLMVDTSEFRDIIAYMTMQSLSIEKNIWPEDLDWRRTPALQSSSALPSECDSNQRLEIEADFEKRIGSGSKYLNISDAELSILILDTTRLLPSEKGVCGQDPVLPDTATSAMSFTASSLEVQATQNLENEPSEIKLPTASLSGGIEIEDNTASRSDLDSLLQLQRTDCFIINSEIDIKLSSKILYRWALCTQALIKFGLVDLSDQKRCVSGYRALKKDTVDRYVRQAGAPGTMILEAATLLVDQGMEFWAVSLVSAMYGGIHLSAWNLHFPSSTEALLWKISAIGLCFWGLYLFSTWWLSDHIHSILAKIKLSNMSDTRSGSGDQPTSHAADKKISRVWDMYKSGLFLASHIIGYTFFLFCRLYLVTESFISLRAIPLGALSTTPWVQSLPHV